MSYFDNILHKRGYDKCPLPLWKLKITDEEFKELRELLEKRTHYFRLIRRPPISSRGKFTTAVKVPTVLNPVQ